MVGVDREAERHGLAFARILARERQRVSVAALAALDLGTGRAAAHLALGGDAAVGDLVALGCPLHQFVGAFLGVLGLLFVGAGHGAGVGVAGGPATDLGALRHLGIAEQQRGLQFVVLVALVRATGRRLEAEADVEIAGVIGCLHGDREVQGLRRALGLQFLGIGKTLHVEVQSALLFVAADAGLTLAQAGGTAVVGLLGDPFDGRHAGVEDLNVALGHLAPVRSRDRRVGTEGEQNAGNSGGNDGLAHGMLLSNECVVGL